MTDQPTTPGTDLATFNPTQSAYPVLFNQDGEGSVAEIIEDNFGDEGFSPTDLDRITVPAGGGTSWEIPDEEPSRVIEGVIVHKQPTRSFWFKKRGEGGEDDTPPDCYSDDAKVGHGVFGKGSPDNPSGECAECPMNVFGSSDTGSGNGKACKEQMQLFLLQDGAVLPVQLSLPPTSLRPFKKYMTRLASKGKSYLSVVTKFSLVVTKGGGQTYSVVDFARGADLAGEESRAARGYGATIGGLLEQAARARVEADEAAAASDGGSDRPAAATAGAGATKG